MFVVNLEFHNIVAKTLHDTKMARPDTCTAIVFLKTRVRATNYDDLAKLVHMLQYLRGTSKLSLTLSANGSGILKWWLNASFSFHPNMRGHSGGGLSLGRVLPIFSSTKQNINTKSSMETEIMVVDNFMPAIWWTRYFIALQGYNVSYNSLQQDNKSSIILGDNGKSSSRKITKHINIRYFFITDRVNNGEVKVFRFPTGDMIGDYITKPLQGAYVQEFQRPNHGSDSGWRPRSSKGQGRTA